MKYWSQLVVKQFPEVSGTENGKSMLRDGSMALNVLRHPPATELPLTLSVASSLIPPEIGREQTQTGSFLKNKFSTVHLFYGETTENRISGCSIPPHIPRECTE